MTLGLEEGDEEVEEGVESIISTSDSYEEDEEESPSHGQATPRPRLRPFFGSDTLSLISNTQVKTRYIHVHVHVLIYHSVIFGLSL